MRSDQVKHSEALDNASIQRVNGTGCGLVAPLLTHIRGDIAFGNDEFTVEVV